MAHVGPTAVPGTAAVDVLDLQLGVAETGEVTALREALAAAGFPPCPAPEPVGSHAAADPGRAARLVCGRSVRRNGGPRCCTATGCGPVRPARPGGTVPGVTRYPGVGPEVGRSSGWSPTIGEAPGDR